MGKILGTYLLPHPPILIPDIGCGEERKARSTIEANEKIAVEIANLKPDTIVFITPHGPVFRDSVAIYQRDQLQGDFQQFGASHISFSKQINRVLVEEIVSCWEEKELPVALLDEKNCKALRLTPKLDHGCMVPMHFIDAHYQNYQLVHITYGMLSSTLLYEFGAALRRAIEELPFQVVLVASGDLSHRLSDSGPYEYHESGPVFDRTIVELLTKGDVEQIFELDPSLALDAGECGLRSIYLMLGTMKGMVFRGEKLSYEGPYGVGYGVMRLVAGGTGKPFELEEYNRKNQLVFAERLGESPQVRLARESLTYYLVNRKYMELPDYIEEEMRTQKNGVFVSMKKHGELRGCVGTIFPATECIADEIIRNAVEAAEHDLRFLPVQLQELKEIVFSVDVLTTPVAAAREELDPARYGVIVSHHGRRGLLLPALEGVDTVDQQLRIALQKAGIGEDAEYHIERFEVVRYH